MEEDLEKLHRKGIRRQRTLLVLELIFVVFLLIANLGLDLVKKWSDNVGRGEKVTEGAWTYPAEEPSADETDPEEPVTVPHETSIEAVTKEVTTETETEVTTEEETEYTNPVEAKPHESGKGYTTIAAFGVDARDSSRLLSNTNGDVCMIISIDNETKEVRIASVYRDFAVETEPDTFYKLTASYRKLSCAGTVAVLNRNLDLNIENYVVVNWLAVADAIDMMGGIDVDMTAAEVKALGQYVYETMVSTGRESVSGLEQRSGVQHLDGVAAVCYCRIRKGVGDDYARTGRQRKVIGIMLEKLRSVSVTTMMQMIDSMTKEIATSYNNLELLSLAADYKKYSIVSTVGFPYTHKTHPTNYQIYADDFEQNVKDLHKFLYPKLSYTPSDNVLRLSTLHEQLIEISRLPAEED